MGVGGVRAKCRECSRKEESRGWKKKWWSRDWLVAVRIMCVDEVKARQHFALPAARRKEELSRAELRPKSGGRAKAGK